MKNILCLKEIFKKREVSRDDVINVYDHIEDTITIRLLQGSNIDATQVALVSNVMSLAQSYNNKKFAIKLLEEALAEMQSDHFRETGNKLS